MTVQFANLACLLVFAAALGFAAPPAPDERPAQPGEWGFRPAQGAVLRRNPPPFVWRPQNGAASYIVQCSRSPDFQTIDYEAKDIELNVHCPPVVFEPGKWYWRFAFVSSDGQRSAFSAVRQFVIPEDAAHFPRPPDKELFARIPRHPRLFLRPEKLPELRRKARSELKDRLDELVAWCEKTLKNPPDVSEPPKYPPGMKRLTMEWRKIWWGNRVRTIAVTDGAARFAFTYLLTGNRKYAEEGKRLLLAACSWDPLGATDYRYNDEAGMPFAYFASRAYTWLFDVLSEQERAKVRQVMAVRGKRIYDHLRAANHTWRPYGSHRNRAWHYLGEVGIAFYGEIPDAARWLSYAMDVFYTVYPVWNDADGGWHEGPLYWSAYINRVTWWLDIIRECFAIDGYKLPYFQNAGYFALYQVPPGAERGAFGDMGHNANAKTLKPLMAILARQKGNPYWQWYVEQTPGREIADGYLGFLRASLPKPKAKPPSDLPSSRLFAGTGVAALHSDLVNRENDVQILFKSDPLLGTTSHGYDAQNSFLLEAFGKALFIRTGERVIHGCDHHKRWMWETKSVNSILVDGRGQRPHNIAATGRITEFYTSPEVDYVVGDATRAYEGRLKRFTRAILFLKPRTVLIWDRLEAPKPATFQWLLHSLREMQLGENSLVASNPPALAKVTWLLPAQLKLTQSNKMDPPPLKSGLVQWHVTAETTAPAAVQDFVTVIQVFREGEGAPEAPSLSQRGGVYTVDVPLANGRAKVNINPAADGAPGEVAATLIDAQGKVRATFLSPGRGSAPPPGSTGA